MKEGEGSAEPRRDFNRFLPSGLLLYPPHKPLMLRSEWASPGEPGAEEGPEAGAGGSCFRPTQTPGSCPSHVLALRGARRKAAGPLPTRCEPVEVSAGGEGGLDLQI